MKKYSYKKRTKSYPCGNLDKELRAAITKKSKAETKINTLVYQCFQKFIEEADAATSVEQSKAIEKTALVSIGLIHMSLPGEAYQIWWQEFIQTKIDYVNGKS